MGDSFVDYLEPRIKRVDAGHTSPCWLWQLATNAKGYARSRLPSRFNPAGRALFIHRVSYERAIGPIPDGLVIDHLCRNRSCLNPAHLEPVTPLENQRRGRRNQHSGITHCKWGHELTAENVYLCVAGKRQCVICTFKRTRESRARRKALRAGANA